MHAPTGTHAPQVVMRWSVTGMNDASGDADAVAVAVGSRTLVDDADPEEEAEEVAVAVGVAVGCRPLVEEGELEGDAEADEVAVAVAAPPKVGDCEAEADMDADCELERVSRHRQSPLKSLWMPFIETSVHSWFLFTTG